MPHILSECFRKGLRMAGSAEGWTGFEGRRRRRIAQREREILAAAARVFAEKSYANATTKDIAAEADMAEGTLYNYFASKREILLAIAGDTEAPMESAVIAASGMETREAMVSMFAKALDLSGNKLAYARTLVGEAWVDDRILEEFLLARLKRIHARLARFISERIASGDFRPLSPDVGAQMAMGACGALLLPVLRGVKPVPPVEERQSLAEMLTDLFLEGVRARPAINGG